MPLFKVCRVACCVRLYDMRCGICTSPSSNNLHTVTICSQGIISDLFPGVVLPKPDYAAMETAMQDACAKMNLQPTEYFLLKARHLLP